MKGHKIHFIQKMSGIAILILLVISITAPTLIPTNIYAKVFTCEDALKYKRAYQMDISPDGKWIAYTVLVQRKPTEEAGGLYSELYLVSVETGEIRPYITGKVNVYQPRWSPDGSYIAFLQRRGKGATQVWAIPTDGGEAFQVTNSETSISKFRWSPDGSKIAYIATTPKSKKEKELEKKGYGFIYFEENIKSRNLYITDFNEDGTEGDVIQLTDTVAVWDFEFSPDGKKIAAAISPKNLVDHSYMFKKIYLIDIATKSRRRCSNNPGKLGNFAFSPDGKRIAYCAALERKDHAVSQAFVVDLKSKETRNLTPEKFRGHINWVGWKDNKRIIYRADEGVWSTLTIVDIKGRNRNTLLNSKDFGGVFYSPSFSSDLKDFALIITSPTIPGDVYYWKYGSKKVKRLTELNPWIKDRELGKQEVIRYKARDGLEIEGVIVYPVGYEEGKRYPLIVAVHGGPESHYPMRWLTGYFNPAQVLAGKGYVIFYPNYRASTGYGVEFAAQGYGDAAGKEFDDIADGIDFLIEKGIADPERVGLGGGSYGGYASAWFASFYTEKVRAVCMFVGISDLISKRGTTDIPYEELYVHSGKKLEEMWDQSLKRSPIYWAHQSKTAVLILGGKADTRVHPSQSLEFYRRLKMNNHPAVRLVQYPGEGHGNRRQPGRIDVLYRHLQWYDWYVKELKSLDGPMPPLDISDMYGVELNE